MSLPRLQLVECSTGLHGKLRLLNNKTKCVGHEISWIKPRTSILSHSHLWLTTSVLGFYLFFSYVLWEFESRCGYQLLPLLHRLSLRVAVTTPPLGEKTVGGVGAGTATRRLTDSQRYQAAKQNNLFSLQLLSQYRATSRRYLFLQWLPRSRNWCFLCHICWRLSHKHSTQSSPQGLWRWFHLIDSLRTSYVFGYQSPLISLLQPCIHSLGD